MGVCTLYTVNEFPDSSDIAMLRPVTIFENRRHLKSEVVYRGCGILVTRLVPRECGQR